MMDKPLIHYGVEESYNAGMNDITFVVGRNKESIVNYFDINYELENEIKGTSKEQKLESIRELLSNCAFSYIRQGKINGLGDAIRCVRYHVERRPFAVLLSDDLCVSNSIKTGVLSRMQEIYTKEKCTILAVQEIDKKDTASYGIVDVSPLRDNLFEVRGMVEKPEPATAPSNLAIIGRYIIMPSIFDYLDVIKPGINNELQITDALAEQVKQEKVLAYKIEATRFDCGSHAGFYEAFMHLLNKNPAQN